MASGYVGMVSQGADMNASQFYITLSKARWMDKLNVVFGKIVRGMVRKRESSSRVPGDEGEREEGRREATGGEGAPAPSHIEGIYLLCLCA